MARTESPTGSMSLILSFGPSLRVSSASSPVPRSFTSFVVGMYDEPATTEHDGIGHGLQVDLSAQGALSLFGPPLDELANRTVPLDEVAPFDVERLVARMLDVPTWSERVEALEAELEGVIGRGPSLSPQVAWVERQLRTHPSGARIGVLADEVGWSAPTLAERFRREVGVPPKTLARVHRYRHARARLGASPSVSLAAVAAEAGYADQAHLTREFRAFSDRTPSEFLASARA